MGEEERNKGRRSLFMRAALLVAAAVVACLFIAWGLAPRSFIASLDAGEQASFAAEEFLGYYDFADLLLSRGEGAEAAWGYGDSELLPEEWQEALGESGLGERGRAVLLDMLALGDDYESLKAMIARRADQQLSGEIEKQVGTQEAQRLSGERPLDRAGALWDFVGRRLGDAAAAAGVEESVQAKLKGRSRA